MSSFPSTPTIPFSGVSTRYLISHACLAPSLTFLRVVGVLWRKFMAVLAMSSFVERFYPSGDGNRNLIPVSQLRAFRDNFGERKSACGSFEYGVNLAPAKVSQFTSFVTRSIYRHPSGRSRISRLLYSGGPSAISRLVVSVWVDSINRVLWGGLRPHVALKGPKVHPRITHRDTPSSVVLPLLEIRIETPSFHPKPRAIKGRFILKRHGILPSVDRAGITR